MRSEFGLFFVVVSRFFSRAQNSFFAARYSSLFELVDELRNITSHVVSPRCYMTVYINDDNLL